MYKNFKGYRILFVFFCILFYANQVFAQDLEVRLSRAIFQKRTSQYFEGMAPFQKDATNSPNALLNALAVYEQDTLAAIRSFVCDIHLQIAWYSKNDAAKTIAVEKLCAALSDPASTVVTNAAQSLAEVAKIDFSEVAKKSIINSFERNVDRLDETQIKLVGYLEIEELRAPLQRIQRDREVEKDIRWASYLALSRMGDEYSINFILAQVQKIGENDDAVYNMYPDLIYTRQPKAFDYLITVLNNTKKNCSSPNPDNNVKIVCGYRVMEMLAPVIKDYPLKISASGGIDAKDYKNALETVRKWFEKRSSNYVILKENF